MDKKNIAKLSVKVGSASFTFVKPVEESKKREMFSTAQLVEMAKNGTLDKMLADAQKRVDGVTPADYVKKVQEVVDLLGGFGEINLTVKVSREPSKKAVHTVVFLKTGASLTTRSINNALRFAKGGIERKARGNENEAAERCLAKLQEMQQAGTITYTTSEGEVEA